MGRQSNRKSRKDLREARWLTLVSALFVAGGVWMLAEGEAGFGLITTLFFGACLIVGILLWVGERSDRREGGRSSRMAERMFAVLLPTAALLMGLGCLGLLIMAFFDWAWFSPTTTTRYPRAVVITASLAGTVLFGGGSVVLMIQARRDRRRPEDRPEGGEGS